MKRDGNLILFFFVRAGGNADSKVVPTLARLLDRFVLPLTLYFLAFCALTWPRVVQFSADGLWLHIADHPIAGGEGGRAEAPRRR